MSLSLGHETEPGTKIGPSSEEGPAVSGHTAVFLVGFEASVVEVVRFCCCCCSLSAPSPLHHELA